MIRQAYYLKFPSDVLIKNCLNYITQKWSFKPGDTKYTKFANKSSKLTIKIPENNTNFKFIGNNILRRKREIFGMNHVTSFPRCINRRDELLVRETIRNRKKWIEATPWKRRIQAINQLYCYNIEEHVCSNDREAISDKPKSEAFLEQRKFVAKRFVASTSKEFPVRSDKV